MLYQPSFMAIAVFLFFTLGVVGLSFYLGRKAKSASGYYAAHGEVPWFVNGIAFAGDYLSAASFLGICGLIAFYGYDGFLYSIGYLAGWIVALFVVAEPIRRLGKFTFADALDASFHSRSIKLTAAISTLVVSIFYLIPQMVGAGSLVKPLLGLPEHWHGVLIVGVVVVLIVVTAGMVSTTYVQFIKGGLLVFFCMLLTVAVLARGISAKPAETFPRIVTNAEFAEKILPDLLQRGAERVEPVDSAKAWRGQPYLRYRLPTGETSTWRASGVARVQLSWPSELVECQLLTHEKKTGKSLVNGLPQAVGNDLKPGGFVSQLGTVDQQHTGPLGPVEFLRAIDDSTVLTSSSQKITEANGDTTTVYYPRKTNGQDLLVPGGHPTLFKGVKSKNWSDKLNFISLMLALFCGTASLPHILIRYYTVKDAAAARKSTVTGIFAIGAFYVLTLYLGLGAMTSGYLDITDSNMAAPLLAKSLNNLAFATISAIAFTTVLGTVSGLILAASGAVAHDLMTHVFRLDMDDHAKVRAGKIVAVIVGIIAMVLGVLFKDFNVSFLVGWAFNIAASANLPALIMLLYWKRTTKQGIAVGILVGMLASLGWILLSADAYQFIYGFSAIEAAKRSPVPFNQPGLITIPLGFLVVFVVSLVTPRNTTMVPVGRSGALQAQ